MKAELFRILAKLSRYPGSDYFEIVHAALDAAPESQTLSAFGASVAPKSLTDLQEQYTKTFDLNPVCAPELGWHLFGETYERGAFLVRVRQELARYGITECSELPDHLAYALELTSTMPAADAEFFVEACFFPGLQKMMLALPEENTFRPLLLAIRESLEEAFPVTRETEVPVALTVLNAGAMQ